MPWFTQLRNISLRVGISDFGHFSHVGPRWGFFVVSLLFCSKLTDRDADCCIYLRNGYCCQKKCFWEDFPKMVFLYRPLYTFDLWHGGGWVMENYLDTISYDLLWQELFCIPILWFHLIKGWLWVILGAMKETVWDYFSDSRRHFTLFLPCASASCFGWLFARLDTEKFRLETYHCTPLFVLCLIWTEPRYKRFWSKSSSLVSAGHRKRPILFFLCIRNCSKSNGVLGPVQEKPNAVDLVILVWFFLKWVETVHLDEIWAKFASFSGFPSFRP